MKPLQRNRLFQVNFRLHLGIDTMTGAPVYQPISERALMCAVFGATGSGKSVQVVHQTGQIVRAGHGLLLLDGNRLTAQAALDDAIRAPRAAPRILYLSSDHQESTAMIDFLERHAQTPLQKLSERATLAKDFTHMVVRTAAAGGGDSLLGIPRLTANATLGFYGLYDANLPLLLLPFLFMGPSPLLFTVLARSHDQAVQQHFRKLAAMEPEQRSFFTESILTRLHELFSFITLRTLFARHGDISVRQLLAGNYVVIVDCGPADGNSPEHARLFQGIIRNAYFRAAMKRVDDPETPLHPCHLYFEEAATGISPADLELTAQARKSFYWATYILQGLEGLKRADHDLTDGLLNNTGTKLVFKMGNDKDARRLSDILYAAQADPRRILHVNRHTSQRVVGHERLHIQTRNETETRRDHDFEHRTRSSGTGEAVHFLPSYGEHVEETPVFMSTNDQFLEGAGEILSQPTGHFILTTPAHPAPRHVLGPLPPDPYRCMPGLRQKRRQQFLARLFANLPYRDTTFVLRSFEELSQDLGLALPQLPPPDDDGPDCIADAGEPPPDMI